MEDMGSSYRGWSAFGKVDRYGDWCSRILDLQNLMERHLDNPVSLRQVDNYLLSVVAKREDGSIGLPGVAG